MSNANGGPARRDGIVLIPQLTEVKVEDHHQDDLVLVKRLKMVPGVVKPEPNDASPDDASQQVRGLGGPAQAPPSHEQVNAWLAQGCPLHGAQPCGFGGPAQAPPVQVGVQQEPVKREPVQAPAAEAQPAVHVPVLDQQAPAAAVQAPAQGGPVRHNPRPEREKKPSRVLKGYFFPDKRGRYEPY